MALLQQLLRLEGVPPGAGRASLFTQVSALRMHRIEEQIAYALRLAESGTPVVVKVISFRRSRMSAAVVGSASRRDGL